MSEITLKQLAEHVGGTVSGDGELVINAVATIDAAKAGEITFFSNEKYLPKLKTTNASAVIVPQEMESPASLLIADDPYYAFMQIVVFLHGHREHNAGGISKKASIAKTASIGDGCNIGDFAVISEGASVDDNCNIYPGVFIGPNTAIGCDCIIYPNAAVYDNCVVGDRVIIHANATVGQDGFGFATHNGIHHKIPQIGRVILEDDVEIGSNTIVERGTLEDTIVGAGTKVGDAVAIGHGAVIGPHCLIVPQAGIAGSATLGHHCVIGGQAGMVGHIKIGNLVKVGAKAGISNDVPDGATVLGTPAVDFNLKKRMWVAERDLPNMRKKLKIIDKRLNKLEETDKE
jgi:UDP-3-O-[3-hydroxymyristoyl] glucosamine N-acyltransferase